MRQVMSRTGMLAGLIMVVVALTSCGADNPKVSDASAFVAKCEKNARTPKTADAQTAAFIRTHAPALCQCIQQKFAASGLGDKGYSDSALKHRPEPDACGRQVLSAAGGSTGTSP